MAWPNVYGLDVRQFHLRQVQPRRPTIVLLHDAFHGPSHFDKLEQALRDAEFRVFVPQLPSASPVISSNAFDTDVRAVIECIKPEIDSGRHVVVVAHGYGSIPGAAAAERLTRYSLDRPRAGRIVKLIFVSGVLLRSAESYLDVLETGAWMDTRQGLACIRRPEELLFQDCSPETRAAAISCLTFQNESSLRASVASPGWNEIPILYVVCEGYQVVPSETQHGFVRAMQRFNRQSAVVAVQTDCPFLTIPRETAELIIRASS